MSHLSVDLNDLYLFAQVVNHQGFSAASKALNIPKSRISRRISLLESKLETRLLQRTSRVVNLTEAGHELYLHCTTMIAAAEEGEFSVRTRQSKVMGRIRISLPVELSDTLLSELLVQFMLKNPLVKLDIQVTNRMVNLLEERFDIVVRGATQPLEPSSLIQSHLYYADWGLVASPTYLDSINNASIVPADLSELDLLAYSHLENEISELLLHNMHNETSNTLLRPRLLSDNLNVLKKAAVLGLGITNLPLYACADELAMGTLQRVLKGWSPRKGRVVVLFPSRNGQVPAVRKLLDFLKTELPSRLTYVKA